MSDLEQKIYAALADAVKSVYGIDADEDTLLVEAPRDPKLGDYATSTAMRLARTLHKSPMEIGEALAEKLREAIPEAESVTVAKPGFINFRLKSNALSSIINRILEAGADYGRNDSGMGERVLVEWVSANPTGDMRAMPRGATASAVCLSTAAMTCCVSSMSMTPETR